MLYYGVVAVPGDAMGRSVFLPRRLKTIEISRGDILVVAAASPDIVLYFPIISAVIAEQGGLTSHAALLCREYGMPCLVQVNGVVEYLRRNTNATGQLISAKACFEIL